MTPQEVTRQFLRIDLPNYIPAFMLLFDGQDFLAAIPIQDWESCFHASLQYPCTSCSIIHNGSAPPRKRLEVLAQACHIYYNGQRHARPITILEIVRRTPATVPA